MAQPLIAPMPPNESLGVGCSVTVNAIDPTDGSQVTGVTVSNFLIRIDTASSAETLSYGPFMFVPGPGA